MSPPTNMGKYLEDRMYQMVKSLQLFDEILTEKDLINTYGWNASGIDLLLKTKTSNIFLQLKWKNSRRRENKGINSFIRSVEYIASKCTKHIYGIWVARIEPFSDNKDLLMQRNIYSIYEYDDIENLVNKTAMFLRRQHAC